MTRVTRDPFRGRKLKHLQGAQPILAAALQTAQAYVNICCNLWAALAF